MNYLTILLFLCTSVLWGYAESSKHSYLMERLSEAYSTNNALIHKNSDKKNLGSIELLTDNYIDQLLYIKDLSDDRLKRKLNEQKIQHITESILLKKCLMNQYDRETHLIQNLKEKRDNNPQLTLRSHLHSWNESKPLIYKTLSILNRLDEAPGLIERINGIVDKNVILHYQALASKSRKHLIPKKQKIVVNQIIPTRGVFDKQHSFYAIGFTDRAGEIKTYLARISIIRKEHGLYFEDIQEIQDTETQKRILTQLENIQI